jgi:gamma-glutamyl-gamma-aminobutyrate hydrolase PuuD
MFQKLGWDIADTLENSDLIQFTGGQDVHPSFYGEMRHPKTFPFIQRDRREALIYSWGIWNGRAMAGICRGGQFLNVLEGGKLIQHADGHIGVHDALDTRTGEEFYVTSTHHQLMVPGDDGKVIISSSKSHQRERVNETGGVRAAYGRNATDVEALHYKANRVFCFQPHPEYTDKKCSDLAGRYDAYLKTLLF